MAFRGQDEAPTDIQYKTLIEHCVTLCLYMKILPKNVIGHREVPGMCIILGNGSKKYKKECPGMKIDLDKMRNEISCRLQRRLWSEELYNGKIDGIFGIESINALKAFNPFNNKQINWKVNV
jgi:N-acetyl-anhydromuramyl-L-alanine amidase AmpD